MLLVFLKLFDEIMERLYSSVKETALWGQLLFMNYFSTDRITDNNSFTTYRKNIPPERYRSELQTADLIRGGGGGGGGGGSQNPTAILFILYLLQVFPFVSSFSSYMFLYCLNDRFYISINLVPSSL